MRAVVQRVLNASVTVDGKVISSVGQGLMVLVGVERNDTPADASWIIKKVLSAKLWDDEAAGAWRRNVADIGGEVLCVSQFTLFANFKGARPDFHESMSTLPGKAAYHAFLDEIRAAYHPERIKDGEFGAMMQVALVNDGPVTVMFDSRDRQPKSRGTSGATTPTVSAEDAARAKLAARAEKKAEWERRKAAGDVPAALRAREGQKGGEGEAQEGGKAE
ncbi:D-tyrosyl-tRNA(Tyr) deacylase [Vanrija albida]|uniref:D-aminoacyl-tRNA deacylase n=1 Tax=Vanrija albida TaxID=181172 RepID=A0ABR3QDX2_9TREE